MLIQAYSTLLQSCPLDLTMVDERAVGEDAGDIELAAHLDALRRHARHQAPPNPVAAAALQRHLRDIQRFYAFRLDNITDHDRLAALTDWAGQANAVLVADGALLDGQGRPLLPGPHGEPTGQVPFTAETRERATAVRKWLADAWQVKVPEAVPPARADAELTARSAEQTGLRVLSLVLVSDFAASLIAGRPIEAAAMQRVCPRGFENLTPDERALFDGHGQTDAQRLRQRIEAAQELLWALSRIEISWPNHPCPVDEVKRIVLAGGEEAFMAGLALRPPSELADEHECLSSLVWAIDDAAQQGAQLTQLDAQITIQRLAAMNWLRDDRVGWDDALRYDRMVAGHDKLNR
ncbi:MAG: DUF4272 domain-containing protein [Brooklawnia sp.]|jgi:hypothetical protein